VRLFEEAGIIERHDFRDGRSRYEEAQDDHHDHLIDMNSGEVIEFFDEEIEACRKRSPNAWATSSSTTGWSFTA
jgi:Fur family ferric uptake transcriptional regulator